MFAWKPCSMFILLIIDFVNCLRKYILQRATKAFGNVLELHTTPLTSLEAPEGPGPKNTAAKQVFFLFSFPVEEKFSLRKCIIQETEIISARLISMHLKEVAKAPSCFELEGAD